jgi:phage baseplate assembly protein W
MSAGNFLGTGWSFPPSFDNANFKLQLSSGEENIKQSIDLLFKTPQGSRSLMPEFGSGLFSYLFRRIDATLKEEIIQSVTIALLNNEPRISVESVNLALSDLGVMLELTVTYQIRQTNTRHNHVFPFSQLEGNNLQAGI